jgi:hypothetical protein
MSYGRGYILYGPTDIKHVRCCSCWHDLSPHTAVPDGNMKVGFCSGIQVALHLGKLVLQIMESHRQVWISRRYESRVHFLLQFQQTRFWTQRQGWQGSGCMCCWLSSLFILVPGLKLLTYRHNRVIKSESVTVGGVEVWLHPSWSLHFCILCITDALLMISTARTWHCWHQNP